jgi:hypothetical protein
MDDTLLHRLRQWLTPEQPLRVLQPAATPPLRSSFRLYILGIDTVSRGVLDPGTRQASYERLRDRLFPHLALRLDAGDVDECMDQGRELWLTPAASERWLQAAHRSPTDVSFSFLYLPFAIVVDGFCRSGGWVVPPSSRSPFPYARIHASFGVSRVALRLLPGPGSHEDPAESIRMARR